MSAVQAVTLVEVEAAFQRISRGESTLDDANLLRSVFQQLMGKIRLLEEEDPLPPLPGNVLMTDSGHGEWKGLDNR